MKIHIMPLRVVYLARGAAMHALMPERLYVVPCWLAADYRRRGIAMPVSYPF